MCNVTWLDKILGRCSKYAGYHANYVLLVVRHVFTKLMKYKPLGDYLLTLQTPLDVLWYTLRRLFTRRYVFVYLPKLAQKRANGGLVIGTMSGEKTPELRENILDKVKI